MSHLSYGVIDLLFPSLFNKKNTVISFFFFLKEQEEIKNINFAKPF